MCKPILGIDIVQLLVVITLNNYERQFIQLSVKIANDKIQNKIDDNYENMKESKLIQMTGLANKDIDFVERKLNELKDIVVDVSQIVAKEIESGIVETEVNTEIEFKFLELIRDKEYAKSYFKASMKKSFMSLKNELNIVFGTNILALGILLIIAFRNYKHNIGKRLSWITLTSVIVTSSIYFLNQNFLYTLLMNSHSGFGYSLFLGSMILILAEIGINRGRIIGHIITSG